MRSFGVDSSNPNSPVSTKPGQLQSTDEISKQLALKQAELKIANDNNLATEASKENYLASVAANQDLIATLRQVQLEQQRIMA